MQVRASEPELASVQAQAPVREKVSAQVQVPALAATERVRGARVVPVVPEAPAGLSAPWRLSLPGRVGNCCR